MMLSIDKIFSLNIFISLLLLLTGCGGESPRVNAANQSLHQDKPAALRPLYQKLSRESKHNAVLNNNQIGVAALGMGELRLAAHAFDRSLMQIETVYANTESAAKARSLWFEEGAKDFKGEPYERVMAYYYRGLLYMMDGDYENARASFKGGILQDAFAEEKQNRCDFALMIFLEGWASQQLGDTELAKAAYIEVKKLRPDFATPALEDNILLISETGLSPRKVSDGVGHSELKFRRGKQFKEKRAAYRVKGKNLNAYPMEDIFWQATSRGGRPVDRILEGKVEFRNSTSGIGLTLSDTANEAMSKAAIFGSASGTVQVFSGGVAILGAVTTMAAIHSRPEADIRYWKNLPDGVHIFTMQGDPKNLRVQGLFKNKYGRVLPKLTLERNIHVADNSGIAWFRSQESIPSIKGHNVLK
ncbi:MAG: hypothetical protein HQL68_11185 [Magnetococcales bacterium]|nr:hypothetical protein [Magnetococcales bacterium]